MTKDAETKRSLDADIENQLAEIEKWWQTTSVSDLEKTLPKTRRYGSADIDVMGISMLSLAGGHHWDGATDEDRMRAGREMAILFYMLGKLTRALGAYQQGDLPTEDTLFDITVYSLMLRRVRQTGRWVEW